MRRLKRRLIAVGLIALYVLVIWPLVGVGNLFGAWE